MSAQVFSYEKIGGYWPEAYVQFGAYRSGSFIAVGGGYTLVSRNGLTWAAEAQPTNATLLGVTADVAPGDNNFVAIGNMQTNGAVQLSTDGVSWSAPLMFSGVTLNAVVYGNGLYVAVGQAVDAALIATSSDGTNWTTTRCANCGALRAVAIGGNTFVAVGEAGTALTSTNGVIWKEQTALASGSTIASIAYGRGMFVAGAPPYYILTSTNALNWTLHSVSSTGDELRKLTYGGGVLFALVSGGGYDWSTNGIDWVGRSPVPEQPDLSDIVYGSGSFVMIGLGQPLFDFSLTYILNGSELLNGTFRLTCIGGWSGQQSRIQASTNLLLTNWMDLFGFTNVSVTTNFIDMAATDYPHRFYRVISH